MESVAARPCLQDNFFHLGREGHVTWYGDESTGAEI
jgi:hypothetical protein